MGYTNNFFTVSAYFILYLQYQATMRQYGIDDRSDNKKVAKKNHESIASNNEIANRFTTIILH